MKFICVPVLVAATLSLSGCAAFTAAKPYINSANDAARALCASYEAEKDHISVSQAFAGFCSIETNWGPFLSTVLAKQQDGRTGVPLKTAARPERCAEPAPGSAPGFRPQPSQPVPSK